MGVLSALPLVNLGNLCCCFWVVSGGLVAAYLLQQGRPDAITPSEGAIVGLLAGIVGAFVQFLVSIPIGLIVAPLERGLMQRAADMAGNMPPALREAFGSYSGQRAGLGFVALLCVRIMGLGVVFSTFGGLVGAVLFQRRSQPVADVPSTDAS
ncbi:MAG: hypothetical protein DMF90_20860 [Acidobacteria bacterium]|nr:MAG: hypothetical protein DMF90_20860 [Acidobacteriota bacterium]